MNECSSVKAVTPRPDYSLLLTFKNGEQRIFDAKPLLEYEINDKLKNIGFFMQAKVMYGTVIWNDDIDIDPEHLYENSTPINNS